MMAQRNLLCLRQVVSAHAVFLDLIEDLQREVLRRLALRWIDGRIDSKQAWIAGRVRKRRDSVSKASFLTHAPIESRAAAVTKNRGKQINRRNVRMRDLRNMPGQRETRQLRREFLVHDAAAELRRLARNVYGRERPGRMVLEEIAQLPINRFRVDIADDDKGKIVRHVTRLVILHHLIAGEL